MAVTNIAKYEIGYNDQFFFDTNVWILLFGTVANYEEKNQKAYSKFLENLITKDKGIYITSMVISEFANVLLRKGFKHWSSKVENTGKEFKRHYVATQDYENNVKVVSGLINRILKLPNIVKVGDSFNAISIDAVQSNFLIADFNDSYFVELAKINNYKIVTNDKDFQKLNGNIEIITTQV